MTIFDHRNFLATLSPNQAGVYQMLDSQEKVLYVGKAKDLKKRLTSYFYPHLSHKKIFALVKQIAAIEITITKTEADAFILEYNLIKRYLPRYNVLFRDDKSYPYIFISNHRHPRITFYRGNKTLNGRYFGPYPNSNAVRESLRLLQKLFPIRQCADSYYNYRQRPCLQYQLNLCLAPCCNRVSDEVYLQQTKLTELFLTGCDNEVISRLVNSMEYAAKERHYETAARYRNQIQALHNVKAKSGITGIEADTDVLAIVYQQDIAVIHLLMIRQGKMLGSRNYYPKIPVCSELQELSEAFLLQHYLAIQLQEQFPKFILLTHLPDNSQAIAKLLSQKAGYKVALSCPQRGNKKRFTELAATNAYTAWQRRLHHTQTIAQRIKALITLLELTIKINRIGCFDISHTFGEKTVASYVVFNNQGPITSEYRLLNITGIRAGDDYAAMEQAVERQLVHSIKENKIPDILFIDGGRGQLAKVTKVLLKHYLQHKPLIVGVAKGDKRKPGLETLFFTDGRNPMRLPAHHSALHLIQQVRDEAHRFAITGHRQKRDKERRVSLLENIPRIGPKRRQQLLKYLGGWQGVKGASAVELAKIPGISKNQAQYIYQYLHN